MTNYEKDIAICEAASKPVVGLSPKDIGECALDFWLRFTPSYVRELLEAVKERDELKEELRYLVGVYKDSPYCDGAKELLKDE